MLFYWNVIPQPWHMAQVYIRPVQHPNFHCKFLFHSAFHFFSAKFMSADEEFFDLNGSDDNTNGAGTEESDVDSSENEHVRTILHVPPPDADISVVRQVSNTYSWYYEPTINCSLNTNTNRPFWRFRRHIQSKGNNCGQSGGHFLPPKGLPAFEAVISLQSTPI